MKLDPDVTRFSKEALLLTAVATEAFLEGLTDHAAAAAKVRTDPAVRPVTLTWTDDRLGLDALQSGAMAGSLKRICFSTSNLGVEVDLTRKNKGQIDGGIGWGNGREVDKP